MVHLPNPVLQRDEKYFQESDKFIPERWLKDNGSDKADEFHPFAYLPFGFGKRMCIGKRIADMEMELVIARIVRNFKVEWHYSDFKFKTTLVHIPVGDFKFRFVDL